MISKILLTIVFVGTTLVSGGCAWINAAGKASEGAGQGLEEASSEEAEGSFNRRVFKFGGAIGQAVGKVLQKSANSDTRTKTAKRDDSSETVHTELIRSTQRRLYEMEFLETEPDGISGEQTKSAIKRYQKLHSLPVDGRVSQELWDHMK